MYLQFISFLHTYMAQVVEILHVTQRLTKVRIMDVDIMAMQWARPSATMTLMYEQELFGPYMLRV